MADLSLKWALCGTAAGHAVNLGLYPLDTIKTRLQSKQGFIAAGGLRNVYKGMDSVAICPSMADLPLKWTLCGAAAGLTVNLGLYPLDTIKTRLQTKQRFIDAGGLRNVYKRMDSVVIGSAPQAAYFFLAYGTAKQSSGKIFVSGAAAIFGEIVACLVRVPTELVKQRSQIVRAARVKPDDIACEIGPGPGGITRPILEAGFSRIDVIEIDHRFIRPLEYLAEAADDRMHIHHADVLKTDVGEIWNEAGCSITNWYDDPSNLHLIENLPFNIASPFIIKYLKDISYGREIWSFGRVPLTLTFQLEVAQRIRSPIACDTRSRLSVVSQYLTEPELLFRIPGSCFVPKPDVDVGVVRFTPRDQPLIHASFEIANDMAHSLLASCRIDPTTMSIRLGVEQYADLAGGYAKQCKEMPGLFPYDYTKPKKIIEKLKDHPNALPPTVCGNIYFLVLDVENEKCEKREKENGKRKAKRR